MIFIFYHKIYLFMVKSDMLLLANASNAVGYLSRRVLIRTAIFNARGHWEKEGINLAQITATRNMTIRRL